MRQVLFLGPHACPADSDGRPCPLPIPAPDVRYRRHRQRDHRDRGVRGGGGLPRDGHSLRRLQGVMLHPRLMRWRGGPEALPLPPYSR
jgi:hypothetical protein